MVSKNKIDKHFFCIIVLLVLSNNVVANKIKTFTENDNELALSMISGANHLAFEQNKGQITDNENNPAPYVLYKAQAPGLIIWVTDKGLTYQFTKFEEEEKNKIKKEDNAKLVWHRVDMQLKDATILKENIIEEHELKQGTTNYFFAHCPNGIMNVKTFSKITIKNIYEGIDWVLYANNNDSGSSLKQDFVVHPNADASKIKLIYQGSGKFNITNNQIQFQNDLGKINEGKLFCYQNAKEINSGYLYKSLSATTNSKSQTFNYEVSIQLDNYNKNQTLIIDPQLVWATFYGESSYDGPMSIDTDANNNVFITGYVQSTNFPLLNAGGSSYYQGTNAGSQDIFILKFDNNGQRLWATYYGGTNGEKGLSLCVDPANDIFISGFTASTNFPVFNAGTFYQGSSAGGTDVVVLKFSNTGQRLWATYYGGTLNEECPTVSCDAVGNIFIAGYTGSTNFPVLNAGGASYFVGTAPGGVNDIFISKFSNTGNQLWSTYYGGSLSDVAYSLCVDLLGNVYITGQTGSANFPTFNLAGAFNQAVNAGGGGDAFILKFNNTGTQLWSTFYGGNGNDNGFTILSNQQNEIYLAGATSSNNIPIVNPGSGAYYQATPGGGGDVFISKFNTNGLQTWGTYYGGSGIESHSYETDNQNIGIDTCGNIYFSFFTTSTNIPVKNSGCASDYFDATFNSINPGNRDLFIVRFTNTGIRTWATYFGGDGEDFRQALAIDNLGNLFITGEWRYPTNNATYPIINPGGTTYYDGTFAGIEDGYIGKFVPPVTTYTQSQVNVTGCTGCNGSATINLSCGMPPFNYVWSNNTQSLNDSSATNTISNLCPGTYTVTVTSSCSQTLTATFTILPGTGGTPITSIQNPVICSGSSFTLPDGSIVSSAGTYVDTIQLTNGCDSIITTNLTIVNSFNSSVSATICSGQNYTLPGGTSVNTAGVYIDTVLASGGCDSIISTTISISPAATFSQNINICNGQTYTLPGGTAVNVAGTYIDTILTSAGCDSIITTILNTVAAINISQNIILCSGQSYILPGGNNVSGAGTYIDTLIASGGCDSIISTNITIKPNSTNILNHTMCQGESYTLPGGTIATTNGIYYDTLLAVNGCDSIITTNIIVNPLPNISISGNTTIAFGDSTSLIVSGGSNYNWSPVTGLNNSSGASVIASPNQTTTYCVVVMAANGCIDTACVTVTVETPCPKIETLDVPNAFSPNNDGVNDEFCLQGWDACIEKFSVIIYNRWGQKVFESIDPNFCWDGIFNNSIMESQVFVYYIKASYLNNDKPIIKNGNITLIR